MRRRAWFLVSVLVLIGLTTTALVFGLARKRDSTRSVQDGPIALTPVWSGARAARPPTGLQREIVPGSYRELAAYRSRKLTLIRVFTARLRKDDAHCFGLRAGDGLGMSCAPAEFPNGSLVRFHRTGFGREAFGSGIVTPSVARLAATDATGGTTEVGVRGGAFVFEGRSVSVVGTFDSEGRPLDR